MRWFLNSERVTAACLLALLMTIASGTIFTNGVFGQTPASDQPSLKPKIIIARPRQFKLKDQAVGRVDLSGQTKPDGPGQEPSTLSVPPITPLPESAVVPDSATRRGDSGATPAPPPRLPVDTELIPGRVVEPIDLANALRLAGARNLDIAVTRQQIFAATADLTAARALWLPSLFYGPRWYLSDGQIQTVTGEVATSQPEHFLPGWNSRLRTIQYKGPPPGLRRHLP